MSFYRRVLFPRLMNAQMSSPQIAKYRAAALAEVSGQVLEIGFGTGLNLGSYPASVRRITAVDANPGMHRIARQRIEATGVDVDLRTEDVRSLPFADEVFDSVVSTWTRRITPINKRIADGCHLNKDMRALIQTQPWRIERLDEFYAEGAPKIFGYLYTGVAVK